MPWSGDSFAESLLVSGGGIQVTRLVPQATSLGHLASLAGCITFVSWEDRISWSSGWPPIH